METYELMVILPGTMPEAEQKKTVDGIKTQISTAGKVTDAKLWGGNRTLTYPILKLKTGHYWLFTFVAGSKEIPILSDKLHTNASVLRYLILKKE